MNEKQQAEVIRVTREELLARRAVVEAELECLRSHACEDDLLRELSNIAFLLGDGFRTT
jgi:hypothetical protein